MSSIRRILSGISSAATWAARIEVTAPMRSKPMAPVEPVRRGFSDHSDFQSSEDAERSMLDAHTPTLAGRPRRLSDPMSAYTGRSDFQARLPRYQHLLGTNIPPPPARYWDKSWRSGAEASTEPLAQETSLGGRGPSLTASADLEKSAELSGEDDSVLLYSSQEGESGRSVVQHPDGSVTDPEDPENHFPDAQAWEAAHPELTRAASLSRNDLELVLAMPEGDARDEVLSELASPGSGSTGALMGDAGGNGFMPSLDDLPVNADPAEEQVEASNGFAPSLDDLPVDLGHASPSPDEQPERGAPVSQLLAATTDAVPLTPEELQAQLSPEGGLAEGRDPLDVAGQVARRGTPEMQSHVASVLHDKSRTPDFPQAAAYTRGAALAASGSPQAAQALLHHVGEANLADFVRTVLQA